MMKTVASLLTAFYLLFIAAVPALAQQPAFPHFFWGNLTINGAPAPAGTTVEARGAGVISGNGNPLTTTAAGMYGGEGPLDPKLLVQGSIAEGATITFYVNGVNTGQSAQWHAEAVDRLDLMVTISAPVGGGGGGGGGGEQEIEIEVEGLTGDDVLKVDSSGKTKNDIRLRNSGPGKATYIDIAAGTVMKAKSGESSSSLTMTEPASKPLAPPQSTIVRIQELGPSGTTFDPPITLTMSFDPAELPAGVSKEDLSIAFWDGTKWVSLETTLDAANNTLSARVSHFTVFGILAKSPEPAPTPPSTSAPTTPAPSPPATTSPAPPLPSPPTPPAPTSTPAPGASPAGPNWGIIGVVIVAVLAAGLTAFLVRKRMAG